MCHWLLQKWRISDISLYGLFLFWSEKFALKIYKINFVTFCIQYQNNFLLTFGTMALWEPWSPQWYPFCSIQCLLFTFNIPICVISFSHLNLGIPAFLLAYCQIKFYFNFTALHNGTQITRSNKTDRGWNCISVPDNTHRGFTSSCSSSCRNPHSWKKRHLGKSKR